MSLKILDENDLPHELFNNNMLTDIKLANAQISKIIQSGGFLGKLAGPLMKVAVPLAKNI